MESGSFGNQGTADEVVCFALSECGICGDVQNVAG